MIEKTFEGFIAVVARLEKDGYRPTTQWVSEEQEIVTDWVHPKGFACNMGARVYLRSTGPQYFVALWAD